MTTEIPSKEGNGRRGRIAAPCRIVQQDRVIVIGGPSNLSSFSEAELPGEATMSSEIDIALMSEDDANALVFQLNAVLGQLSDPHRTHGF